MRPSPLMSTSHNQRLRSHSLVPRMNRAAILCGVRSLVRSFDSWVGRAHYTRGKQRQHRGDFQAALADFVEAEEWLAKANPNGGHLVAALICTGSCNARLGNQDLADTAYRRALQIIERTEGADHPKAREIRTYLAT